MRTARKILTGDSEPIIADLTQQMRNHSANMDFENAAIIRDGKLLACDSVSNLSHSDIKRVTLKGATEIPQNDNIRDLKTENGITSFLYNGKSNALIKELANLHFEDLTITDPELSEVFMHYYRKDGEQ